MAPPRQFAPLPTWPEPEEPISFGVDGVAIFIDATGGLMLPGSAVEVGVTGDFNRGIARDLCFKIELHQIADDASPVQLLTRATVWTSPGSVDTRGLGF
jgi:hypothetical protein